MTSRYAWNKEFRQRIIALCLDSEWFARFGTLIIRPEYFDLDHEQEIVKEIIGFYSAFKRAPDDDELASLFEDDDDALELISVIYDYEHEQLEFAELQALQYAKEQAMKLAILNSVDDIQKGILSTPLERVKEALKVGTDLKDIGIDIKSNMAWVFDEVLENKIQTGIMHLDLMLGGGLAAGEIGVVMAGPNVGKTMALINIGCGAATIISKCNVAHITAELSARKVAKRYAARSVFRWLRRDDDPEEYWMDFQDASDLLMPGSVYIKEFPAGHATVADIDAYIERLSVSGINIDVLVVDYLDELKHTVIGEYRHNVANTVSELRALASIRNIPVWTATQTTRAALSKPLVELGDVAESFEKVRKADVVLTVCQTTVEEDEDLLRLFAAKVRDGDKGWMIRCHIDREAHAILSEEVITVAQLLQELKDQKKSEN